MAIKPFANPQIRHINSSLVQEMGLPTMDTPQWLNWIYHNPHHKPIAQKYAGHQFGQYNPELGDGRGLLLGEWQSKDKRWDLHLKGAGQTPYSRMGDGRAVLRSTIREYLASEALHALNIPTSRALCLISSDEPVIRETVETGAMMIRTSASHIRFGTLENYFHTGEKDKLERLFDYIFQYHFPHLPDDKNRHAALFSSIVANTATLIARWQAFGFAHGVMNTDNMSIHGITFDYGPYGFLDDYEPGFICNHSDYQGRYSFENQPSIGLWNLNMMAHAFTPYMEIDEIRQQLQGYEQKLVNEYNRLMASKIGLDSLASSKDMKLLSGFLNLLERDKRDYHLGFRLLAGVSVEGDNNAFADFFINREKAAEWLSGYLQRIAEQSLDEFSRSQLIKASTPKYVLRNYLLQIAIEQAEVGDFDEFERLYKLISSPFDEQPEFETYSKAPPDSGKHLEISCSS